MSVEYCESATSMTSMTISTLGYRARCTEAGCGNLARLGFRYAVTTGRPMKEECGVLLALRRPARDWRFGSQRCETGRCASSVRD
jgi:hypothetical protein